VSQDWVGSFEGKVRQGKADGGRKCEVEIGLMTPPFRSDHHGAA